MRIKSIKVQPDASAWSAVVCYGGEREKELVITALYAAGSLKVEAAGYDHSIPMHCLGAEAAVLEWAQLELAKLPDAWHVEHSRLYDLKVAA